MIRVLLFDAFRTILDSRGTHIAVAERIVERHRLDVSPDALHGKWDDFILESWESGGFASQWALFEESLSRTFEHFGVEGIDARGVIVYWRDLMSKIPLFPEAGEVLRRLAPRYRLALLSNTDNVELENCLRGKNLPFEAVFTSEDIRCYKPSKKAFDAALARLGCRRSETVVVGDSPFSDVLGARNAGLRVVWVNRTGARLAVGYPEPDAEIPDLLALPETLEKMDPQRTGRGSPRG
ncbi:MAG: HAD family hydrolase [bacterium]